MAILKKYKSMVNLPQPSGLNIQVNKDIQPFNAPIQVMAQRAEHESTLALDDLDNKIEKAKLQNKDQKTFLNEQETMFKKRNKTLFDNTLLSEKIKLIEFDNFLKNKHWNSPTLYEAKFGEYIKVKIQSGLFPDPTRLLKFQEKASSLGIASMDEISKNVAKALENESWELLNLAKEKISTNIQERIFSMDSLSDVADQNALYAQESINLEGAIVNYIDSHQQISTKTEADLHGILDSWRFDHDKAFIEHFLTNIIMQPDEPNSVFMAEAIWEAWKSGTKLEAIDKNLMATGDYYKKETPEFWLDLLNRYTYDQHPLKSKEDIISKVDTAITNKKKEWKDTKNQGNKDELAELNITFDILNNKDEIGSWKEPTSISYDKSFVESVTKKIDANGDLVTDKERVEVVLNEQATAKRLETIVNELRDGGKISDAMDKMQDKGFDLTKIGYPENYSKEEVLYDVMFKQDTSGIDYNTSEIFNDLALLQTDANAPQHASMSILLDDIKKWQYMPKQMIDNINIYKGLNFDNDADKKTLMSMAMVKMNAFGEKNIGNLDPKVADALNRVYFAMPPHGISGPDGMNVAIEIWKNAMNTSRESERKRMDVMTKFIEKKKAEKTGTWIKNTLKEDFEVDFKWAVARQSFLQVAFYWTWGENRLRQMFGMEAKEGERTLDNIIKYKNNFIYGTRKNLSMEHSAFSEFEKIYNNIAWEQLNDDDPSPDQLEYAYRGARQKALKIMTGEEGYDWSMMMYHPDQTVGLVLTKNSPEKVSGMSGPKLSTNATAFAYNHIKNMELNDQFIAMLGTSQSTSDMDEFNNVMRNFFKLDETRGIRLVENTSTLDREITEFHIMLRNTDGDWKHLMDGVEPVSWKPNTVFSDTGTNYSRNQMFYSFLNEEIDNIDLSMGKSEIPVRIEDPKLRQEFVDVFTQMYNTQQKFAEAGDWFQETFPNFPFFGQGKGADDDIDTINEKLTQLADTFEFKIAEKQNELNIQSESEMKQHTFTHKISYDYSVPSELSPNAKFEWLMEKNQFNINKYNEIYGNIGTVVDPAHQFVIIDIIDALAVKNITYKKDIQGDDTYEIESVEYSDSLKYISEGSEIYEKLKNEQWRDAREALEKLYPLFENNQRFKALVALFGINANVIR